MNLFCVFLAQIKFIDSISLCGFLMILLGLLVCGGVFIWYCVLLGSLETLPQVCVFDPDELSVSNIDSSSGSLYPV